MSRFRESTTFSSSFDSQDTSFLSSDPHYLSIASLVLTQFPRDLHVISNFGETARRTATTRSIEKRRERERERGRKTKNRKRTANKLLRAIERSVMPLLKCNPASYFSPSSHPSLILSRCHRSVALSTRSDLSSPALFLFLLLFIK